MKFGLGIHREIQSNIDRSGKHVLNKLIESENGKKKIIIKREES